MPHSISAECCAFRRSAAQQRTWSQTLNDLLAGCKELQAPGPKLFAVQIFAAKAANTPSQPVLLPLPPLLRSCILLI